MKLLWKCMYYLCANVHISVHNPESVTFVVVFILYTKKDNQNISRNANYHSPTCHRQTAQNRIPTLWIVFRKMKMNHPIENVFYRFREKFLQTTSMQISKSFKQNVCRDDHYRRFIVICLKFLYKTRWLRLSIMQNHVNFSNELFKNIFGYNSQWIKFAFNYLYSD